MPVDTVLLVLILLAGFYMAWNIGANDVANAMGTSVGSKALTLSKAILIAAILEFSGAFFFGSHVSETIQSGIVNPEVFSKSPLLFVYGMLSALLATGFWLQIASYFGWPVSTTHAIVGAVIGFGALIGGIDAVYWDNVFYIVTSWVLSPLLGGLASFLIFSFLRKKIFYTENPVTAAKRLTPFLTFSVFTILGLIIIYNGLKNIFIDFSLLYAILISTLTGLLFSVVSHFLVQRVGEPLPSSEAEKRDVPLEYMLVEQIFGGLQILTACAMAFAHGANDVANAIGPFSAALAALQGGIVQAEAPVPSWALALGGFGIVIGLATWGWRVIETIGKKITELTPTRGFAAEFGAAATVILASRLGLPISTTHTLVGSVIGVGLARGIEALDLSTTRDIVLSWLITIPASALLSFFFFYGFLYIFN